MPPTPLRLFRTVVASLRRAGADSSGRRVQRPRASPPQAQLPGASPQSEPLKQGGVPPSPAVVEVRPGGTDPDELHVDVQAVFDADDVAEQPPVLIHAVGCRFRVQADTGAMWEQPLRDRGRLRPVALSREVDLGRVDLDQADTLPVAERHRVAVSDVVDHVVARLLRRSRARREGDADAAREAEGAEYAYSQAIPSLSRSRARLYDIASRYSRLLRVNVVTGVPEVWSRAPSLPTPCGYRLCRLVQFLYRRGHQSG
jgi:hypothetical protein